MKLFGSSPRSIFLLLLAVVALAAAGCATDEPQNESARPWDSPKGWENGIPSSMTQGR